MVTPEEEWLDRRTFNANLLGLLGAAGVQSLQQKPGSPSQSDDLGIPKGGWITDVEGIKVGHFTDERQPTGCTVVLCEDGATCGVDVRGGWPGTRLTDALDPVKGASDTIFVNAISLAGGSNYGLAAASGVEQYLREQYIKKLGPSAREKPMAFAVPAAIIYDIELGDWTIVPTAESGYKACLAAKAGPVEEGNVGAGTGATIGKIFSMKQAMKSGLGTSSTKVGDTGVVVGALAVVNALGDVIDPRTGKIVAGARSEDGRGFINEMAELRRGHGVRPSDWNTTIAVVATNATFTKTEMNKIAQMASAGLARTINPVFTTWDGDAVFAISTRALPVRMKVEVGAIGAIAAEGLAEAVLRAVFNARGLPGLPAYRDIREAM
jgi:L-aminopeptidase/D-esterase-like protein